MGQKKRDRSTEWALNRANKKLEETTRELMRRATTKTEVDNAEADTHVQDAADDASPVS